MFVSLFVCVIGSFYSIPTSVIAIQVFLTVMGLFVFGSSKYRIDKNALTYGAGLVIFSTFINVEGNSLQSSLKFLTDHLRTFHGWDELIHADTLLFILGLTLFVSVIAQTRLLETVSISVLRKNKGRIVPTIAILTAIVSFLSGILDGVSMIGLTIRILVMILFLACVKEEVVKYMVMVSTVVTTVCGMWLAYGEPPNLIMKANLHPYLDNAFFLRYCLPVAIGSYFVVAWNLRKKLKGKLVEIDKLDILDLHMADVRFLQAVRHGEVLIPSEFIVNHKNELGSHFDAVEKRISEGESFGTAMVMEDVPKEVRKKLIGLFLSENLSDDLDNHYEHLKNKNSNNDKNWMIEIKKTFQSMRHQKIKAQWIGGVSFIPFVGFLILHAFNHNVPLFVASFAGFFVAVLGVVSIANMRRLALREAMHEYKEYLFLIPLFFSITLLQKVGFFNLLAESLRSGIEKVGVSHIAYVQFTGATFLSAILDNNVVADFSSRALQGLEVGFLHLFAMAQIAGYATGGCWTHIGSAQSVVAYSFIRRQIDKDYTPIQWIKAMTPIIIEIFILMTIIVYGEALILKYL